MDVAKYYNDGYDVEVPEDDDFDLEYIDLDEEEVLRHEVQREKTLKEAWLNLKGKQISLAFVRTAIRARETKDKIDNIVKKVSSIFLNQRYAGKINYKPYFQRNYVWDEEKALEIDSSKGFVYVKYFMPPNCILNIC